MLRAVGDQDLLRPGREARFTVITGDCLARSGQSERVIEPVVDQRGIFVRRKREKVQGQLAQGQGRAHRKVDDILVVAVGQQAEERARGKRAGMRGAAGGGDGR